MTSFYLNQFSLDQDQGDHDRLTHLHPFTLTTHDHLSPLSSYPILFNPPQPHGPSSSNHQVEFIDQLLIQGTSNFPTSFPNCTGSTFNRSKQSASSSCDQYTNGEDDGQHKCTGKWMSSKMRIMRKMMSSDGTVNQKPGRNKLVQDQEQQKSNTKPSSSRNSNNNNSSSDGIIRVCSDCYTTKTPLWRSGPSGPKSLCNACGIRQRKARRALAAAAAVSSGLIPSASVASLNPTPKVDKDSDCMDRTIPFKKRCRFQYSTGSSTNTAQNKKANKKIKKNKQQLGFDDIVIRLSKSSAFHQVFPQDEKDAAILLMALSCGLMCS